MTSGYRIKDVATRSGFSPATLRYYEEIGLLRAPERTASGYRIYGEATLDRLAFIARAKQLGCSLEEIADLVAAWEGGRCGPVQDRLRSAVAGQLDKARQQITELTALTQELHHAAAALERHRPEGACDDRCGCVTPAGEQSVAAPSMLPPPATTAATPGDAVAIACTLGAGELRGRIDDWQALLAHVARRERITGGIRLEFGPTAPSVELMRLVAAEQDCCQFFAFAITVDTRGVALEVTAPGDALPIVEELFGAAAPATIAR